MVVRKRLYLFQPVPTVCSQLTQRVRKKYSRRLYSFSTCSFGDKVLPAATRTRQRATLSAKQQVEKDEVVDFIFFLPHPLGKRGQGEWDSLTCSYAAKNGHLHVLKWARENGEEKIQFTTVSFSNLDHFNTCKCIEMVQRKW